MFSKTTLLLAAMLMSAMPVLSANDSPEERASLKGLGAISLVLEDPGSAAQKYGLTAMRLENEIRQRLQQAGIAVRQEADPYLYVQITLADAGSTFPVAYAIQMTMMQEVALPRGLNAHFQAPTWWQNSVGMAGADRVGQSVAGRVQEFVDQFVKAYQSANPKP